MMGRSNRNSISRIPSMSITVLAIIFMCRGALAFGGTSSKLGSYNIDQNAISISGLSSGGFMAAQMHVIESETFMGVGIIAGGPYNCAKGSLSTALTACMSSPAMMNVNSLITNAKTQANNGNIDAVSNLYNSKVYLYSGTRDTTVYPDVVYKTEDFYKDFVNPDNFLTQFDIDSQHGFPTMNNGGACERQYSSTYINDCDYDTAYHLLNHIYGGQLEVPSYSLTASDPKGTLITFDQSEFISTANPNNIGMDSDGFIFVPDSCVNGNTVCRLHVSLHGCHQGKSFIDDTYAVQTGYNEVGGLNDIIVIYPQASTIPVSNPNGCWDFWGYTNANYDYHDGLQVTAIMKMIDRITAGSSGPPATVETTSTVPPAVATTENPTTSTKTTTTISSSPGDKTLGSYHADKSAVSVSGLASGGFMAVQMHVAVSESIMGAGAVAGGPYYCAMNNVGLATTYCMYMPYMISVNMLESAAEEYETDAAISSMSHLSNDKVYLYSGSKDTVVFSGVVEKADEFYRDYISPGNIKVEFDVASQNGFPTMNKGGACDKINSNGLNNCGFAGAYQILNHIYGDVLQMPDYSSNEAIKGELREFSQTEFTGLNDPTDIGLSETGMVFVPSECTGKTACKVHVAFHGCKQGDDSVAEDFARDAGYNEVAALNNIIVLYPRTATILLTNPQDCWDWWGYTNKYYATKDGPQINAVMSMVSRLLE